jgi:hypothetical protein
MRSLQLQAALTEYFEAAAVQLHAEVAAGAEVAFELEQQRKRRGSFGPALSCYRPLTDEFIAERDATLERLPSHAEAERLLAGFDGLARYLTGAGGEIERGGGHASARVALRAMVREVFSEQTDFQLRPERVGAVLERLEHSALTSTSEVTLVATLRGLTITSPEIALAAGLTIAQVSALDGLPAGALGVGAGDANGHLVVVLSSEDTDATEALARGREVLQDLLRALRLFGDGRVSFGALAWARVASGTWTPLALGAGGRPRGMLVVTAEQEDELRAFCNLVSRRAPHGNELAWALRRFEFGAERESATEALTDHVLALRALLEPEGAASGLLAPRLAALCATAERRAELADRTLQALALERAAIVGTAVEHAGSEALAKDLADHLRALLRDVICGHLAPDLVALADEILRQAAAEAEAEVAAMAAAAAMADAQAQEAALAAAQLHAQAEAAAAAEMRLAQIEPAQSSSEQMLGNLGQAEEILDVFI